VKKSSHWYRVDGSPCHEVPNKAKGGNRPTTLTDARKLGLLPSVTTILDLLDKPQLNDWKLEQMTAEFCRRLETIMPPGAQRDPSDVAHAVQDIVARNRDDLHTELVDRAFQQVEDAADAGTLIHKGVELALQGLAYEYDQPVLLPELKESFPLRTFVEPIEAFVRDNGIRPSGHEVRIVNHQHGYAGTGDLPMSCSRGLGFGDWKTRKTKPGRPVKAYDTQVMQIGAYHAPHYSTIPRPGDFVAGFNLFVSTTEPGRIEAVWYGPDEIAAAYEAFTHMCALWRFLKGYDPRAAINQGTAPAFA
jgi:hypothetical protein